MDDFRLPPPPPHARVQAPRTCRRSTSCPPGASSTTLGRSVVHAPPPEPALLRACASVRAGAGSWDEQVLSGGTHGSCSSVLAPRRALISPSRLPSLPPAVLPAAPAAGVHRRAGRGQAAPVAGAAAQGLHQPRPVWPGQPAGRAPVPPLPDARLRGVVRAYSPWRRLVWFGLPSASSGSLSVMPPHSMGLTVSLSCLPPPPLLLQGAPSGHA